MHTVGNTCNAVMHDFEQHKLKKSGPFHLKISFIVAMDDTCMHAGLRFCRHFIMVICNSILNACHDLHNSY